MSYLKKALILLIAFLTGFVSGWGSKPTTVVESQVNWELIPFKFSQVDWYIPVEGEQKVEALRPSCPYSKGYRYRKNYRCGVSCHRYDGVVA